jgi:hypothetical protein
MKPFIPSKLAEVVFAVILAWFAFLQFRYIDALARRVPSYFPGGGKIWIIVFAVVFILTAIAILTGYQKTLACYVFAGILVFVAIAINGKMFRTNPADSLRDVAFAMGAIIIGNSGK